MTQDVLDKFLKEVSYKFPKGYPDMKDPQDVKLLNKLVMEYTNEAEDPEIQPQAKTEGLSEYDQIVADTIGDGKTCVVILKKITDLYITHRSHGYNCRTI